MTTEDLTTFSSALKDIRDIIKKLIAENKIDPQSKKHSLDAILSLEHFLQVQKLSS